MRKTINFHSPADAIKAGIFTVHQDIHLYGNLTVAENVYPYLSKEIPESSIKHKVSVVNDFFKKHDIRIDASLIANTCSAAQQRVIELARLYTISPILLILDEPTANLGEEFESTVGELLQYFKQHGTTILLISHNYTYFIPFVNRVSVLRDQHLVDTLSIDTFLQQDPAYLMWGEFWKNRYPKINIKCGNEVLCLDSVSNGSTIQDVSITLHKSEILGIYGKVGSGKSELARTLLGVRPITSGSLYIDRLPAVIGSIKDAIDLGIAYITDDRLEYGLYANLTVVQNVFSTQNNHYHTKWVHENKEKSIFDKYAEKLNINVASSRITGTLSSGEQQKLLFMKWLMSTSRIFIFDEPTQNLDISSKIDIHNMFNDLILNGNSILFCSSNLEELLGVCDRTLFLHSGRIVDEYAYADSDKAKKWLQVY